MSRMENTTFAVVTHDPENRAIRSWLDTSRIPQTKAVFTPRTRATETLRENADSFAWSPDLSDLRDGPVGKSENAFSVRFSQEFKHLPVDASEVVVNIYEDGHVYSIYNNYHYDIPDELDPASIQVNAEQAQRLVEQLLTPYRDVQGGVTANVPSPNIRISEPVLIVYQYRANLNQPPKGSVSRQRAEFLAGVHKNREGASEGQYFLAWDIRIFIRNPAAHWRILIDAITGRVVNVIDLVQYATGTAKVFDPNPIVTSGDTTLRHTSAVATLNAQATAVTVERLDPPDGSGKLHLDGSAVHMDERESPAIAEPVSATGDFNFSFDNNNFLDAMVYFHLDRFQHYVQTDLGLSNVANYSIPADPQGFNAADNSHYVGGGSGTGFIAFGGGTVPVPGDNPVPDAADAMVILHEYGHAIQDNAVHNFDNPVDGTGEGFGDFLAATFYDGKHANPSATRGIMMSWDSEMATGSWAGRRYDMNWLFDGPEYTGSGDNHIRGQLWCATMFELYRKLGGDSQYSWVKSAARDLAIRLHLIANFHVPASMSTAAQMGQQVRAADLNLGGWRYANGLHKKVIDATFIRRHLPTFTAPAVDVYINDGRNGGYGSLTGNDLFTEKLFLDNYWSTQDLWVRVVQYPTAADQQAGDPGDHVEPPVNSLAYLYVRVKNKGGSGSGSVTVRAFHSDPTIGLVWPADWTPTDTPSDTVADIPAGGKHVFGPFPWTPTHVGHECVFAIVECANDRAVTQDLLVSDIVPHSDLVPFDNNIAQRNLYPTSAKDKMTKGFWVSNPGFSAAVVKLHFESTLPKGWTFRTNVANTEAIHLGPRGRRWVEVTIDQANGPEVTNFANPPALTISGSIEGKLIGGMSFYAAPPSAFPGQVTGQPGISTIDGARSALCEHWLKWIVPLLLATLLVVVTVVPVVWAAPLSAAAIILILAFAVYWWRVCKPKTCGLICALILAVSVAYLILGALWLLGYRTPALLLMLALLSVINGVLVIIGVLRGCCGHCSKAK
jgi:hypothetical protein